MTALDTVHLILALAILTLMLSWMESDRRKGIRLARLERKQDALLKKLEVDPDADVDAEVLALARSGEKIKAIKRYRDLTGTGLKEAKEFVERL